MIEMDNQDKITVMQLINSFSLAGAEILVFDLATRMDKEKFAVLVCSIGSRNDEIETKIRKKLESKGIETLSLEKPKRKGRLKAIWKLYHYLREYDVDILHTHCSSPDFYGKFTAFLVRTPLVFSTIHNMQGYSALTERVLKTLTTKYVAISETVKRYAASELKIPTEKISVIYNAIDMQRFDLGTLPREEKLRELGVSPGVKVITTAGRIARQKGHIYLVEAAAEVMNEFPDVHFLIVGDDTADREITKQLKEAIKAKNLEDRILLTGVRTDIPEILSITDVFVLPSLWEGLSIVLLEAMASGVPVVVTDVGSNSEIITNGVNGFIVHPKDSQVLAQKIKDLLSDPEKARKLGTEGQRMVQERFAIDRMIQGYEQLYLRYAK